jgi:hypothetical protein
MIMQEVHSIILPEHQRIICNTQYQHMRRHRYAIMIGGIRSIARASGGLIIPWFVARKNKYTKKRKYKNAHVSQCFGGKYIIKYPVGVSVPLVIIFLAYAADAPF